MAQIVFFSANPSSIRFSHPTWFSWFRGRFYFLAYLLSLLVYIFIGVLIFKLLNHLNTLEHLMLRNLTDCAFLNGKQVSTASAHRKPCIYRAPVYDHDKIDVDNDGYEAENGVVYYSDFTQNAKYSIIPSRFKCRMKNENDKYPPDTRPFVLIKSRPYEFFQRDAIRRTYGSQFAERLVFVVGRLPYHSDIESAAFLEAQVHGDILQVNILDTYFNLAQKSYAALRWILDYCPNEQFYLMGDSDAIFYPSNVKAFAERHRNATRRIYGLCWKNSIVYRTGKWRVSRKIYPLTEYPAYCVGAAYLITGDVPNLLIEQMFRKKTEESVQGNTSENDNQKTMKAKDDPQINNVVDQTSSEGESNSDAKSVAKPGDSSSSSAEQQAAKSRHRDKTIPYMNIDDAYFTGVLAQQAKIARIDYRMGFKFRKDMPAWPRVSCGCNSLLASFEYKAPNVLISAWRQYEQFEARCSGAYESEMVSD